jgi:tripartite-type tricarboxylate transporter receptor subunit TctC
MMTGRVKVRSFVPAALGASMLAAMPACATAEPAATFFQGKQVRFYTMGSPGGGYDTYMRALIPHLERKLGARMLPTNEPGAGGLIAVNRTVNAPPDGLTILLVGGETLVTAQLYDAPGVNYDVRKLAWLARVSSEAKVALLGPKSPYAGVADLVKSVTPVTWAGSSKIDGNHHGPRARDEEQDDRRLQGHRRHESRHPAGRSGRPGRVGGIRCALRAEQWHAGRGRARANARRAVP